MVRTRRAVWRSAALSTHPTLLMSVISVVTDAALPVCFAQSKTSAGATYAFCCCSSCKYRPPAADCQPRHTAWMPNSTQNPTDSGMHCQTLLGPSAAATAANTAALAPWHTVVQVCLEARCWNALYCTRPVWKAETPCKRQRNCLQQTSGQG